MAASNTKEYAAVFSLGAATAGIVFMLMNRRVSSSSNVKIASGIRRIEPPAANWQPGMKQPAPFSSTKMVDIDPKKIRSSYPLMISAYVPRPIALVSSKSSNGHGNVAPYSFSGVAGFDPPTISICVCRQGGDNPLKDTHRNIVETGEFVVNIVNEWFVNAANYTSMQALFDENEMDIAGLTPVPSVVVKPPRVGESAMQFECKLKSSVDITNDKGKVTATVFLGEVVMFHVHEEVLDLSLGDDKPQVKMEGYKPVSRLGGNTYGLTTEMFDIARPPRPKDGFTKK